MTSLSVSGCNIERATSAYAKIRIKTIDTNTLDS